MTLGLMLLMSLTALNGCVTKSALVGGIDDYVEIPKGTKIIGLHLDPIGPEPVDITTTKNSILISLKGANRILKTETNDGR